VPAPTIDAARTTSSGTCGSALTVSGNNFGTPPSSFGTTITLLGGPSGTTGTPKALNIVGGNNTQMTVSMPASPAGLLLGSGYTLVVSNNGGASNAVPFTVTTAC
jgi:hypothetical protein